MAPGSSEHVPATQVSAWVDLHAALMLAAALVAVVVESSLPVVAAACASFAWVVVRNRRELRLKPPFGGWANRITAMRLGLVLGIGAIMASTQQWLVLLSFVAIVVLDAADGYVARRFGWATDFGATFDRETDACFVLIAYLYFFLVDGIGAWILLPGLLPYAYRVLTLPVRPSPWRENKERLAAKLAGVNFVLLLAAVALPPPARNGVLVVSCAIVLTSFALSFIKLMSREYSIP